MLADLFVCLHEHVLASCDAYLSIRFLFIHSQTLPQLFSVEVFYLLGLHSSSDVTRFLVNIKGEMTMKNYSMKVFVSVAVLGTLAFILMMLQFPLLPSAPFLKLDFSDIPALIGGLLFGPLAVILVELIKMCYFILCQVVQLEFRLEKYPILLMVLFMYYRFIIYFTGFVQQKEWCFQQQLER